MEAIYFESAADLRRWLHEHHATAPELWVGFYRTGAGKAGIGYPEAVDEALCFGWIDGIRKSVDSTRYVNRFTPRRPRSNWSLVNMKRVAELAKAGRMAPAGLRAYEARDPERTGTYTYEQRSQPFGVGQEKTFRRNRRVGVLRVAAGVLPAHRDDLGDQRQTRGDTRPPPRAPDRTLRPRRAAPGPHESGPAAGDGPGSALESDESAAE